MLQYLDAVEEILTHGTRKESRMGVDTLSTFNINYEINLKDGFPLLTTKKINWKNVVVENLWFLSGEPTVRILQEHGCKFWDNWTNDDGTVPSAYGNLWRNFPVHVAFEVHSDGIISDGIIPAFNDQIAWVVEELKRNPMSRRLVVSAWAPGNAQTSKLPPCHLLMVFNVQNKEVECPECNAAVGSRVRQRCLHCGDEPMIERRLCLHLTQRSCDIALGVPYNIAGYALLLELISRIVGIKAGIFAHTLVDAHAYTCKPDGSMSEYDHLPGLRVQLIRELRPLPKLYLHPSIQDLSDLNRLLFLSTERVMEHFILKGYNPHPAIKFKVAV